MDSLFLTLLQLLFSVEYKLSSTGLIKSLKHTRKKLLFKLPEKTELTEHKPVDEQKDIINRKNQNKVGNGCPKRFVTIRKPVSKQRTLN